jgi:hypothetical protein
MVRPTLHFRKQRHSLTTQFNSSAASLFTSLNVFFLRYNSLTVFFLCEITVSPLFLKLALKITQYSVLTQRIDCCSKIHQIITFIKRLPPRARRAAAPNFLVNFKRCSRVSQDAYHRHTPSVTTTRQIYIADF